MKTRILYSCLSCLLLSSSLLAERKNYFDYIYTINSSQIFDQNNITSKQSFKQATPEQQQVMLENEYLRRKSEAYTQVLKDTASSWSIWTATSLALAAPIYITQRLLGHGQEAPAVQQPGIMQNFILGAIAQSLLNAIIQPISWAFAERTTKTVSGTIQSAIEVTKNGVNTFMSASNYVPKDDLEILELKYVGLKPHTTKRMQQSIERAAEKERTHLNMLYNNFMHGPSNIEFIEQALLLPHQVKPITLDEVKLDNALQQYKKMKSSDTVDKMKYFCQEFIHASNTANPRLKTPMYFHGAPGTGKTEAAQILATELNVPLVVINLAEVANVMQLKGSSRASNIGYGQDQMPSGPGLIAEKLISLGRMGNKYKNMLVFFDEADRVLNRSDNGQTNDFVSFMLELLEGKTRYIDNPYFDAEIDTRNWGIILAGNGLLTAQALNNRVDVVPFGGYSFDYWQDTVRNKFLPASIAEYEDILSEKDFSEEDFYHLEDIAKKEHAKMQEGKELETDPGFREIQRAIKRYVQKKANHVLKHSSNIQGLISR